MDYTTWPCNCTGAGVTPWPKFWILVFDQEVFRPIVCAASSQLDRMYNLATGFRPPSATVVSAEPFSHGTGTLQCLQKEMATYRHWSVSLWQDTDDVPHCVKSCPLTKLNGGLSRLHSVDEDTVSWLTSYGLWHAYEKKKKGPASTALPRKWCISIYSFKLILPSYCTLLHFLNFKDMMMTLMAHTQGAEVWITQLNL